MSDDLPPCKDCDKPQRADVWGAHLGEDWLCGPCLVKRAARCVELEKRFEAAKEELLKGSGEMGRLMEAVGLKVVNEDGSDLSFPYPPAPLGVAAAALLASRKKEPK